MKLEKIKSTRGNLLNSAYILMPERYSDERGFFIESWNTKTFEYLLREKINFVQDNHSFSYKNVLRGLHYQLPPNPQGKLVRCITGEIFDVIVDIRKSSGTFLEWFGVYLNEENQKQIWIPAGFAHGFLTISNTANVAYKTTHFWDKKSEYSINFNDPKIKIEWPNLKNNFLLSEKDLNAPLIEELDKKNLF